MTDEVASSDLGPQTVVTSEGSRFIASVDVGTTSVRCVVFDEALRRRGHSQLPVELLRPRPGYVEIDPEQLFQNTRDVIKSAVRDAGLTMDQITCLALATQRGSFTTWNRETGKPHHNIICWSDLRANQLVNEWNQSVRFRLGSLGSAVMHLVTRNPRYLAARVVRFMNQQVTMRLLWCLQNVPALSADVRHKCAVFGTVDTYLLYRLTGGRLHVTDCTNAAATGFFDPYTMRWSGYMRSLTGVAPASMLPSVLEDGAGLGSTAPYVLGAAVPLGVVLGDQSASLFGSGCWTRGDVAVTLGTGSFLDMNTGSQPHTSVNGMYPQVAWRFGGELCYTAEGSAGDTAASLLWGQRLGLYEQVADSSAHAQSVPDAGGVCFVPAFSGLAAPVNDYHAAAGFIGVTPHTRPAHLTHAILQAVCFRVRQLYDCACVEVDFPPQRVYVTGGVANSGLVCQLIADLLAVPVRRPASVETTVIGAAAVAGLVTSVWSGRRQVAALLEAGVTTFLPDEARGRAARKQMVVWERALERFGNWYTDDVS